MRATHALIAARLGLRMKELRGQRTQEELAALLGLSQAQYNRYETGKVLAPDPVLERLGKVCGLDPEELVWGGGTAAMPGADGDPSAELAVLVRLLDPESREDLYFFLKNKVAELTRRRRREAAQAAETLERLRKKAL